MSLKSITRLLILLSVAMILPSLTQAATYTAAVNSGGALKPFPQNVNYSYGLMPAGRTTTGMNSASVQAFYTTWCTTFVTDSGAGGSASNGVKRWRVQRDSTDGSDTVSEGIGYGMLIAAMMGDKALFDGLYAYALQYMPDSSGNYLMNWHINSGGSVAGPNGATDADEDMAMALLIAEKQWGNATSSYNYHNEFQLMANAMWAHEMGGGGVVLPGDAYSSPLFSSYMTPAWYKCWSGQDSNPADAWATPLNWVTNTYLSTMRTKFTNGMVPDTVDSGLNATG